MGLFNRLTRSDDVGNIDSASKRLKKLLKADQGTSITKKKATTIPAVLSAVRCISETLASLPLDLYRRLDDGKELADNRDLHRLLKFKPNDEMSSFQFRETMQLWLLTWGNAFANIQRAGNQKITGLWPIEPRRVKVFRRDNREPGYKVKVPNGEDRFVEQRNMLHLKGLSRNGMVGLSPIQEARQSLGLAKAMEEHGAKVFENGAHPGSVLRHPNQLSPEAKENLREEFENAYSGLNNAHRVAVLEEGLEWDPIQMSPEDLQMLDERKFQIREIARIFRIQPHLIQDLEDASFSNIETQTLEFVKYTLRPWLVRWEQDIRNQVIPEASQGNLFVEFNVDGLLRGDAETRSEFYRTGFQNGFFSPNDIRAMENLNPVDGGDEYYRPLNMTPIDGPDPELEGSETSEPTGGDTGEENSITAEDLEECGYEQKQGEVETRDGRTRQETAVNFRPIFDDAAGRVVRRELMEINDLIDRHLPQGDIQSFSEDLRDLFFEEESGEDSLQFFFKQQMRPPTLSLTNEILSIHRDENPEDIDLDAGKLMEEFVGDRSLLYAGRSVRTFLAKLKEERSKTRDEDLVATAQEEVEMREENKQEKMKKSLAHQTETFVTFEVYRSLRVERIIWTAVGDNCPICATLDGKDVTLGDPFVTPEQSISEVGYSPSEPVIKPPAHKACWTPDHDIFTKDGWKPVDSVSRGDKVWTMNMDTHQMEEDVVQDSWTRPHNGKIGHYNTKTIDLALTPDHNMAIVTSWRHKYSDDNSLEHVELQNLSDSSAVPRAPKWDGPNPDKVRIANREWPTERAMQFMGWWLADGTISPYNDGKKHQIGIRQYDDKAREYIGEICEDLFDTVWHGQDTVYCIVPFGDPLAEYLYRAGKSVEREIPEDLLIYGSETLRILFNHLVKGDGNVSYTNWDEDDGYPESKQITYYTSSHGMVDGMTELAMKIGKRVTTREASSPETQTFSDGKTYTQKKTSKEVGFGRNSWSQFRNHQLEWEEYSGNVVGVSMKNNPVVLVRRNGKTTWTGNCDCTLVRQ